jgi:hypothetical protein
LTCSEGGHGKKIVNKGPGYLSACGCPVDLALLELWMVKVTATDDNVPRREDCDKKGDMSFTQPLLKLVQASLKLTSGLTPGTMLQNENDCLQHTVQWALGQLRDHIAVHDPEGSKKIADFRTTFFDIMSNVVTNDGIPDVDEEEEEMD